MERVAFEAMIREMAAEIPATFFDGVAEVTVSPRVVPHPERDGIFTLGECIALAGPDDADAQSRIVLYHGSFQALAATADEPFDWEGEAWETLTHELQHHLEWRARRDDLGEADEVAEANFARQDGEPFDPLFYRGGEVLEPGVYRVDDDVFIERSFRERPDEVPFEWAGAAYRAAIPAEVTLPAYLVVDGVARAPRGSLLLVLQRPARWRDLLRPPVVHHADIHARPSDAP